MSRDHCPDVRLFEYTIVSLSQGRATVGGGRKIDTECRSRGEFDDWVLSEFLREHSRHSREDLRVEARVVQALPEAELGRRSMKPLSQV